MPRLITARLFTAFAILYLYIAFLAVAGNPQDLDSDGDGLSDYQEIHKYRTDPHKKATGDDGISDGDWNKRREYTYSVRSVIRVIPPYNKKTINDDYQDVRIISENDHYIELEIIYYPLNTNAVAIQGNPNWKKDYAKMEDYLKPGVTTNWDHKMEEDLINELKGTNIDPDKLDDKQLVEKVSRWISLSMKYNCHMFGTMFVYFPKGIPTIYPGLETVFQEKKGDRNWTVEQQFSHELFGREMFYNKTYGSCTSAATYIATIFKALGIPARTIQTIPVIDPSDANQMDMIRKNITNNELRNTIIRAISSIGRGFTNHTYNEVYVGHRWVRLNYSKLGQNILDRNSFGLMTHIHTFNDLSEADLAKTWGARYAKGEHDSEFKFSNPYKTMEISDSFGKYSNISNPYPTELPEFKHLTISKIYWLNSSSRPSSRWLDEIVKSFKSKEDAHRLFIHVEEDQEYPNEYYLFIDKTDTAFLLRAEGHPNVHVHAVRHSITNPSDHLREILIDIPSEERSKMIKGISYKLLPLNSKSYYTWKIQGEVVLLNESEDN